MNCVWDKVGEAFLRTLTTTTCYVFDETLLQDVTTKYAAVITKSIPKVSSTVYQFPVPKLDMFRGLTVPSAIRLLLGVERSATTITHPVMGDLLTQGLEKAGKRLAIDKRHRVDTGQGVQELPLCIGGK